MRDFPTQVGPGGEPVSDSASWTSSNANDALQEAQNAITDTGQALISIVSPPDNSQTSQAIARYVATGDFYVDTGAANVYVLNPLASFKAPSVLLDGAEVRWIAANASTAASTINVNGVGVKDLKLQDGTNLTTEIDTTDQNTARFDAGADNWKLVFKAPGLTAANQAEQAAGTSNVVGATPAVQQFHPSALVASGFIDGTGTVSLSSAVNLQNLTDLGTGNYRVEFINDMANATYLVTFGVVSSRIAAFVNRTTGGFDINTFNTTGSASDADFSMHVSGILA